MPAANGTDAVALEVGAVDTGGWSPLHRLFAPRPGTSPGVWRRYIIPWIVVSAIGYGIPLLTVCATLSQESLCGVPSQYTNRQPWEWQSTFGGGGTGKYLGLPFFHDWSLMFMGLVSLPCLVVLLLDERSFIPKCLGQVAAAGVLHIRAVNGSELRAAWERHYRHWNLAGQTAALVVGLAGALWFRSWLVRDHRELSWQNYPDGLSLAGETHVWVVILPFFWILTFYAIRAFGTILFLRCLAANSCLTPAPLLHNRAAGVSEIGRIAIRNVYALAVSGINILAYTLTVWPGLVGFEPRAPNSLSVPAMWLLAFLLAYVVSCPVVFFGPLLPFRRRLLEAKRTQETAIAAKFARAYHDALGDLAAPNLAQKNLEAIRGLDELGMIAARIPTWPLDIGVWRNFLAAYLSPFASAAIAWFAERLFPSLLSTVGL